MGTHRHGGQGEQHPGQAGAVDRQGGDGCSGCSYHQGKEEKVGTFSKILENALKPLKSNKYDNLQ